MHDPLKSEVGQPAPASKEFTIKLRHLNNLMRKCEYHHRFPCTSTIATFLENIKKMVQNSHPDVFVKIGVFKNFVKLTGKPCAGESSLIKLVTRPATFLKKNTLAQVFSVNFAKFLRTYLIIGNSVGCFQGRFLKIF